MVELHSLPNLFLTAARSEALKDFVKDDSRTRLHIAGLQGSAVSLLLSGLPEYGVTTLFIANDAEEAGYLYNDLTQIRGDERVLFFPSGYKRALKYGQVDPAADILRTDTINRLQQAGSPLLVVSYPEALCEKVASNEELHRNTLRLAKGEKCNLSGHCRLSLGLRLRTGRLCL